MESLIKTLISRLQKHYAEAECSLAHENPFQLLIATILSAQCTDARVNKVTPALFKKFPTPHKMAKGSPAELEKLVASTGFYKAKANSIRGTSQKIVEKFNGNVPQKMEELRELPGVGRKTANVVLGNAFNNPDGIVVDTHVGRLSFRLGLTKYTNAEKIEKDLNQIIPKTYWVDFPHWFIAHGREICNARAPKCEICFLNDICPKKGVKKP